MDVGATGSGSNLGSQASATGRVVKGKAVVGAGDMENSAGNSMASMMGHLRLTSKETRTFVLDESAEDNVGSPEWALVGKVLAPNTLHVQTISSVLRRRGAIPGV